MATTNERLMQWLHDARVMETQAQAMLGALARHVDYYPEIRAEAKRVFQETRKQADVVQDAIERRGGDMAILREGGQPGTAEQSLSGAFVGSESAKQAMTKISGYNVIIAAAANAAADSETRAVCEEILRQEEAMVEWLRKYLASAATKYIGLEESTPRVTAKR